jgi:flagellar biosynthesis protein FliQ
MLIVAIIAVIIITIFLAVARLNKNTQKIKGVNV